MRREAGSRSHSRAVLVIEPRGVARREIADLLLLEGLIVLCSVSARDALELLGDGLTPAALVFDARVSTREVADVCLSFQRAELPLVAVVGHDRQWPGALEVADRVTRATLQELPAVLAEVLRRRERR